MNALELHILTTLADVSDASAEEFGLCASTISLLLAEDMITSVASEGSPRYQITEKGLAGIENELAGSASRAVSSPSDGGQPVGEA